MRKHLIAFVSVTLALTVARPAAAQGDAGFYGGIGVAYGAYDLTASGFSLPSTYKNNVAAYGEFGLRVTHHFSLGVEADYYTKGSGGTTFKVWYYNVAAAFYPTGGNLWLKALAGYSNTTGDVSGGGGGGYGSSPSQGGYDMGIGLGYDLRFGHEGTFAVVPFAQYLAQLAAGTPSGAPAGQSFKSSLLMVGAAIAIVH